VRVGDSWIIDTLDASPSTVYQVRIRDELNYLDALPQWAVSPLKEEEIDDSVVR
jgi:hypothetical protein